MGYSKEELDETAEEMGLSGKPDKAELAADIAEKLLTPQEMEKRLLDVPANAFTLFEQTAMRPDVHFSVDEGGLKMILSLVTTGYVMEYDDGSYVVPKEVARVYAVLRKDHYGTFHRRARWLLDCMQYEAAIFFRWPKKLLYESYQLGMDPLSPEEFEALFGRVLKDEPFFAADGEDVTLSLLMGEEPFPSLPGLDFYHPTRQEIAAFAGDKYPSAEPAYVRLEMFFRNSLEMDEDRSRGACRETFDFFGKLGKPEDARGHLAKKGLLPDLTSRRCGQLDALFQEAHACTRFFFLRGHTFGEVFPKKGGPAR